MSVTEASAVNLREQRASALAKEPLRFAGPQPGLADGTVRSIRDLWHHRELLSQLTRREIKARYKDSALGLLWSLIRPLVMLMIYWLVMGNFLGAARGVNEFAIYIFSGLAIWQLFADIVSGGTASIVGNGGLIKKVYVPREVFPLSVVGSALFNFAMQLVILLIFTIIRGQFPFGVRWFFFPLALLLTLLWATALALILSAANVYLRDVQYLVELGVTVLFWMSPVVYAWGFVQAVLNPTLQNIYLANPMTLAVLGFQRAFWIGGDNPIYDNYGELLIPAAIPPNLLLQRMLIAIAISLFILWLAQRLFSRLQGNFAQEI